MKRKILIAIIICITIFLMICILKSNTIKTIINKITNNVKMSEVETKIDYELEKNGENFNVCFILENSNGIEEVQLQDVTIECNGKEKVAIDRTFKENDVFSLNVKIKGKEEKEFYKYIASENPIVHVKNRDGEEKTVYIVFPEAEDITEYYSIDNGQTWNIYNGEITIAKEEIENIVAKIEFNNGKTINNEQYIVKYDYRMYLYEQGDKKESITGGYTFRILQGTSASYQDNPNNMYIYASSVYGVGYGEVELYSNNTINVEDYNTIYFDMDYYVLFGQSAWRCHFYYGLSGGKIIDVPGTNSSYGNIISMDISELTGNYRPYFRVLSCSANKPVWCRIRSIYLE